MDQAKLARMQASVRIGMFLFFFCFFVVGWLVGLRRWRQWFLVLVCLRLCRLLEGMLAWSIDSINTNITSTGCVWFPLLLLSIYLSVYPSITCGIARCLNIPKHEPRHKPTDTTKLTKTTKTKQRQGNPPPQNQEGPQDRRRRWQETASNAEENERATAPGHRGGQHVQGGWECYSFRGS